MNITPKQKKSRTSFRPFSHFLKRSHSANTDLSVANAQPSADQVVPLESSQQSEFKNITPSNTSTMSNSASTALVTISEEGNPANTKQPNTLKVQPNDVDATSVNQSNSGLLTHQQVPKIANSLSKLTDFIKSDHLSMAKILPFSRD